MKNFNLSSALLVSVLNLSLLCSSVSFAVELHVKKKWFACETDSDCVIVEYPCAGGVVNKKFQEEARKHFQYISSIKDCAMKKADPEGLQETKAVCKNGICGRLGGQPKIGSRKKTN